MSFQVTESFVKQFNANIFHLSQQRGSRFQPFVRLESQRGKSQFFDRLGSVVAQKKTSRHSDTPQIDTPHSRRRVTLVDFEHADLIDDADKIRMLIDPASDYAQAFMWAFGRAKDDEIIVAADGDAFGGEEGGTTVVHPNTQKIASVSAGVGANLNVQALRLAKVLFDEADVDDSIRRYFAFASSQQDSLLAETEVTSADFNTVRALVSGEVNQFVGFTYIRTQRLNLQSGALLFDSGTGRFGGDAGVDADTNRKCLAWAQDGLLLATGMDIMTRIAERPDKSHSTQVFAQMGIGSTRLEEEKVVVINCKES